MDFKNNTFSDYSHEETENIIFKETLNNINILLYIKDTEGRYVFINNAAKPLFSPYTKLYGKTDEELYSSLRNETSHTDDLKIIQNRTSINKLEELTISESNTQRQYMTTKAPLYNKNNQLIGMYSISRDITVEAEALNTLNEVEEKFYTIAECTDVGIYTVEEGRLTYVNAKACKLSGYEYDELINMQLSDIIHPYDLENVYHNIEKRLSGEAKHATYNMRIISKDKKVVKTRVHGSLTKINNVPTIVGTITDITDYIEAKEQAIYHASYDQLSGLPNRNSLNERLNLALAQSSRKETKLAILFIDLDRFKYINDTLGHDTGDKLLIEVSKRLKQHLRSSDLVARLGGDEFLIVLEQINSAYEPAEVAHKVITALNEKFVIDSHTLYISASIGIGVFPENGISHDDLIKNAENAMYDAKKNGKGCYSFYTENLTDASAAKLKQLNDLSVALQEKQLYLCYQPQIDIEANEIISLEVLIGWKHPQLGNIKPTKFNSMALESGLTVKIDLWMLEESLAQINNWITQGRRISKITVNILNINLNLNNFINQVKKILSTYNIPAGMLEFYFQQKVFTKKYLLNKEAINDLKELGIDIAIDYNTRINLLRQDIDEYFNKLKIDMQDFKKIQNEEKKNLIIKLLQDLSRIEDYRIVTHNTEVLEDAEYILNKGLTSAQGDFFLPPVTADKITDDYFMPPSYRNAATYKDKINKATAIE